MSLESGDGLYLVKHNNFSYLALSFIIESYSFGGEEAVNWR